MPIRAYIVIVFILALLGVGFSGYLSAVKFFSGTCAFSEPCPYFLGYPACWYGFAMFLVMFLATGVALLNPARAPIAHRVNAFVSGAGILFSSRFVWVELTRWIATGTSHYALGLPTCAYGLIIYLVIFIFSLFT